MRDEQVKIRLTKQEKKVLAESARIKGIGISEFVRDWIKTLKKRKN